MKKFKIGEVTGEYYRVIGPDGEHYRNVALYRDFDGGMTQVYAIITKDTAGKVDVSWSHDDLTDGRINPYYDLGYGEKIGFWESVQEHIRMLESGDIPRECLGLGYGWPECGETEAPGLPEFLNAEPDDMGQLVCRETGETISWRDLA